MNSMISPETTGQQRTYEVLELAPRARRSSVDQIAAVSRSTSSVHITMTAAAAEDLARELSWMLSEDTPDDDVWAQIARDLQDAIDLDTALIPASKWQASVVLEDVVLATVMRIPPRPKHRDNSQSGESRSWSRSLLGYVPRHAKTADEIEASR